MSFKRMATIVSVRRLFRQTGCNFVGEKNPWFSHRLTKRISICLRNNKEQSLPLADKDPAKKGVMQAMLQMDKFDSDWLKQT